MGAGAHGLTKAAVTNSGILAKAVLSTDEVVKAMRSTQGFLSSTRRDHRKAA
jgi:hypothetical protein